MCRKCGLYRRSRAQGPETLPCAKTSRAQGVPNRNQIGTQLGGRRRSPPVDSLNGLNSLLPLLEPSSETLFGNKLKKQKKYTTIQEQHTTNTRRTSANTKHRNRCVCVCCVLSFGLLCIHQQQNQSYKNTPAKHANSNILNLYY